MDQFKEVREKYQQNYRIYGHCGKSLFLPKDRNKERFGFLGLILKQYNCSFSLLDFGCGFADLKIYLDQQKFDHSYYGVDIVDEFIEDNINYFKSNHFKTIKSVDDVKNSYDFITIFGVFNLIYNKDIESHKEIIFKSLKHLFTKTNVALIVNFMTDKVDFKQTDAFHVEPLEIYTWVYNNLSKRLILDQSFLPFEYTLTIFKNQEIAEKSKSDYKRPIYNV